MTKTKEKMLVALALDERDFLKKKIEEQIKSTEFYTVTRKKTPKTKNGLDKNDFIEHAKTALQSIKDKVDRLNRIEAAITLSNAKTIIKVGDRTMSVAEAIALKNSLDSSKYPFNLLYSQLHISRAQANKEFDIINDSVNDNREDMLKSIAEGADKNISTDSIKESVFASTDALTPQMLGPFTTLKDDGDFYIDIDAEKKFIDSIDVSGLKQDILTAIKISNATTELEF